MQLSHFTLQRIIVGFLSLALIAMLSLMVVAPVAAAGQLEVSVIENGNNRITTVADHDSGRTVTQVSNKETRTTTTTTSYADNSTHTVTTDGSGNTLSQSCTGPDGKSVACP
jgi:hypothetical protein